MFALCHFKDLEDNFILYDSEDFTDLIKDMNIEIEKELSYEEFDKDYSFYPIIPVNDLILKAINPKVKTNTSALDKLNISCWMSIKKEYNKIQKKESKLSKSQRDIVVKQYSIFNHC